MNFVMGSFNFLMLPLLIALVISHVQAEAESAQIELSIAVVKTDLERLRSRVSQLELILKDKTNDLNIKRNLVTQREKEIEEQSQTVISVQNLIEVLQEKESGNTVTLLAKAYARIRELETQVEGLKESIRKQKQEQIYLKLQADKAEKKAKDQASKNEKIEYFVSEQWVSIQQTEQALRIAEAIMLKAQAEVADKADGLSKASALYLFPLFGMFTLFSFIFGMSKTFAKSAGSSSTLKTRRKSDRRHAKKWS
ncbi:uncharacterized protein LOC131033927 isoform X3 [Cryptomeria japonica]|uniref:uncharacterized protein LOC131033927 isoform X3 n=1 Tax=Cryptomeria japonica TaxID=3369 RepID=UPI0027DA4E75|nr:uncharacterized protein LOC131033927 isoform X3 [Cryptomeria japonica]